jgi:Tfp pilus assembly protein FimT
MKKERFQGEEGISLIESVIVLTVALILASFTLSNFVVPKNIFAAENVMRELKSNLNKAKADSVRRNAKTAAQQASVSILSNNSYSLSADLDRDGNLEANEVITKTLSNTGGEKFYLSSTNYPIKISFDWRGRVTATDSTGAAVTTAFSYCSSNCPATVSNTNSNNKNIYGISLSALGDAQIYRSAVTSVSQPAAPNVSTVTANANIRTGTNVSTANYGGGN